jgi:hypothetical protein
MARSELIGSRVVTVRAEVLLRLQEQRGLLGAVRAVAGGALLARRSVLDAPGELTAGVTIRTKLPRAGLKQRRVITAMRIVARGAPLDLRVKMCRVHTQLGLAVAVVAELGLGALQT